jgi:KUP system potassium uptake protein
MPSGIVVFFATPTTCLCPVGQGVYLSSNLYKVPQDGWVPLAFAGAFLTVMSVWRYGTAKKYDHDLEHKLSLDWVTTTLINERVARVPGIGLFYSNLMSGVPAIFSHFLASVPALHEVVLFVAVKHVEVPNVAPEERCLFRRLGPLKARMYRCVLRYGYNDVTRDQARTITDQLMEALALFIRTEDPSTWTTDGQAAPDNAQPLLTQNGEPLGYDSAETKAMKEAEVRHLHAAREAAVIHIIGRSYMKAVDGNSIKALFNKLVIDYLFYFLKVNTRDAVNTLAIPQENILEVGMVVKV